MKKVKENYSQISHRYYKIKAKILGKKFLNFYLKNKFFTTCKISNIKSFKNIGYLKNKRTNYILYKISSL